MGSYGVNIVKIEFSCGVHFDASEDGDDYCPSTDNAVFVCVFKSAVSRDFEMGINLRH